MDNRGRVVRDVIESQKPNYLVIDVKALYDILKIWNDWYWVYHKKHTKKNKSYTI